MSGIRRAAEATVSVRNNAAPWRTFRWCRGQKHYSRSYWSATECANIIDDSRLELAQLLYADFDFAVRRKRRHVPDLLLAEADGPVIVNVKPRAR
ncbi:hypothetical protein [Mycolicibacter engbaekii]|uniref:hypothetical protein n=1 Tax=Mycolicibacter engbaekii TaxID=188915 RepID=UPI0010544F8B|nr:hypothetical protein [Mycolicibacter engbaekii]